MSLEYALDHVLSEVERRARKTSGPFIVALDGRSGTGKSTLAAWLEKRLDALVIAGDDFFSGGVNLRHDLPSVLAEDCIDWRRLEQVLRALRREGKAQYFSFDWEAFDGSTCSTPVVIEARPIVIVEGVYAARPELRELIEFALLVEVPDTLRMQRLIEREGEIGAWERQWHRAEDWYFANRAKREDFDMVLSLDSPLPD